MPIVIRYKRRVPPGKVAPTEAITLHSSYSLAQASEVVDDALYGSGSGQFFCADEEIRDLPYKELSAITVTIA